MINLKDLLFLFSKRLHKSKTKNVLLASIITTFEQFVKKNFVLHTRTYSRYTKKDIIEWLIKNIIHEMPYKIKKKNGEIVYFWKHWTIKYEPIMLEELYKIYTKDVIVYDGYSTLSSKTVYLSFRKWWEINIKSSRRPSKKKFYKYLTNKYFDEKPVEYNYFCGWLGYTVNLT